MLRCFFYNFLKEDSFLLWSEGVFFYLYVEFWLFSCDGVSIGVFGRE